MGLRGFGVLPSLTFRCVDLLLTGLVYRSAQTSKRYLHAFVVFAFASNLEHTDAANLAMSLTRVLPQGCKSIPGIFPIG